MPVLVPLAPVLALLVQVLESFVPLQVPRSTQRYHAQDKCILGMRMTGLDLKERHLGSLRIIVTD